MLRRTELAADCSFIALGERFERGDASSPAEYSCSVITDIRVSNSPHTIAHSLYPEALNLEIVSAEAGKFSPARNERVNPVAADQYGDPRALGVRWEL
jgi:hypothetical protein